MSSLIIDSFVTVFKDELLKYSLKNPTDICEVREQKDRMMLEHNNRRVHLSFTTGSFENVIVDVTCVEEGKAKSIFILQSKGTGPTVIQQLFAFVLWVMGY